LSSYLPLLPRALTCALLPYTTLFRSGRKTDAVIEIIEYERPTSYGWVEIIHRRGAQTFFKLEFHGGSTRITMKQVWTPASWRAWLQGQFSRRRNAHKMFDGLLQNLRKALTR